MSIIRNLREEWEAKAPFTPNRTYSTQYGTPSTQYAVPSLSNRLTALQNSAPSPLNDISAVRNKISKLYGNNSAIMLNDVAAMQDKVTALYSDASQPDNPFLDKEGHLFNEFLDYQKLLDNPDVATKTKEFITKATGLTPTPVPTTPTTTAPPDKTTDIPATGNTVADAAKKYLGTPYVWGGESMKEGGMDCSGFVYNALKDAGHNVGRTTAQGYRSYGTAVKKADMKPGDLIFFGKSKATHIGIYLGDGKMIHSAGGSKNTKSNPGKGVSIISVNHRSDFLEARRL